VHLSDHLHALTAVLLALAKEPVWTLLCPCQEQNPGSLNPWPSHYPDHAIPPQCTVTEADIPSGKMQCRATSIVLPLDSSFTTHLSWLLFVSTTALRHRQSSHFTSTCTPGRTAENSGSLCKHNSTIHCWQPHILGANTTAQYTAGSLIFSVQTQQHNTAGSLTCSV
jgi:hypothetical protein